MRFRITHRTTYEYAIPAHDSFNEVRLRPVSDEHQTCLDFNLSIDPPASVIAYDDYYGNAVHEFGIPYLHGRLNIAATSDVVTFADLDQALDYDVIEGADQSPALGTLTDDEIFADDHSEFLIPSAYVALEPVTHGIANEIRFDGSISVRNFLLRAIEWIYTNITYQVGTTNVHSTVLDVLEGGSGVCQDFSHLLISLCRHVGLPARYVSGYLGDVAESEASHAWVEAFVPPYGWVSVDATHGGLCTGRHIKVGVGRDYADVSVVRGTYRGGVTSNLSVSVTSEAIDDERGFAVAGKRSRGQLVQYQALGGMKRWQGADVSGLSGMSQTSGRLGERRSGGLPGVPEAPREGEIPYQQPQQQQQ